MSAAGQKQQLEDEREWRTRIENKIDRLYNMFADDGQLRANCSYIFQPKGPWEQYAEKVVSHDKDITLAKGAIGVLTVISIASLAQFWKAVLAYFKNS
jgi:hypothetical protein